MPSSFISFLLFLLITTVFQSLFPSYSIYIFFSSLPFQLLGNLEKSFLDKSFPYCLTTHRGRGLQQTRLHLLSPPIWVAMPLLPCSVSSVVSGQKAAEAQEPPPKLATQSSYRLLPKSIALASTQVPAPHCAPPACRLPCPHRKLAQENALAEN